MKKYRLLEEGEIICLGDEFIHHRNADVNSRGWNTICNWDPSIGKPWNSKTIVPIRREIKISHPVDLF